MIKKVHIIGLEIFVYENAEDHEWLEDLNNETDPYELLEEFNNKWVLI